MSARLRVFISSTMRDLANERDAVCRRLRSFNFEPVNAESWLPTGKKTWPRIQQEIESSHYFILILGERYGWIPADGPQSGLGFSVTHLEYKAASKLGIPVLPFLKILDDDADHLSEEARKRDEFRKEVGGWESGQILGKFHLASDLAGLVGSSLVQALTDAVLSQKVRDRAPFVERTLRRLEPPPIEVGRGPGVEIPGRLVQAVATRQAVLFAGAGFSVSAGAPSAAVFAEHLVRILKEHDPSYSVGPVGSAFAGIASDVVAMTSRDTLLEEVKSVLNPPQGLRPSVAHRGAARLFNLILTTNWDHLFEDAVTEQGDDFAVVTREIEAGLPARAIVKLHGSVSDPAGLLLTEADILTMDKTRPRLWAAVRDVLRVRPLVVVGTPLRDASIIRLLEEGRPLVPGYFVVPVSSAATAARLRTWGLGCINADADTFMASLALASQR